MSENDYTQWGRVAEDGTVYVKTPDGGEREVGSWHAGSPEEGLAYYGRAYEDLSIAVGLLEQRLASGVGGPRELLAQALRIREGLPSARAVGDLAALEARVDTLVASAEAQIASARAAREQAAADAAAHKAALAEEAERLATSSNWKAAGDRFRDLVEEWKAIRGADRKIDSELWGRVSAARSEFSKRRDAHFAALHEQRSAAQQRKEALVAQAESLAESTTWGPTAGKYRDLMTEWKSAGRAAKPAEEELWKRFRAAQDRFFTRRSAAFAEREATTKTNLEAKERLLAEAEAIDPANPDEAQRRLRDIQDRWTKVGRIPRESAAALDARLDAAATRVRDAARAKRRAPRVESSPLVIRLRESVQRLERKVERAKAAGRAEEAAEAEEALTTQREWLSRAERV
jgi:hypothetical protein